MSRCGHMPYDFAGCGFRSISHISHLNIKVSSSPETTARPFPLEKNQALSYLRSRDQASNIRTIVRAARFASDAFASLQHLHVMLNTGSPSMFNVFKNDSLEFFLQSQGPRYFACPQLMSIAFHGDICHQPAIAIVDRYRRITPERRTLQAPLRPPSHESTVQSRG